MNDWIIPDWPAPYNVKALFTSRNGGVSSGINGTYASLNLGAHVNDNLADVACNRAFLHRYVPTEPKWLKQVHGTLPIWIDHTAAAKRCCCMSISTSIYIMRGGRLAPPTTTCSNYRHASPLVRSVSVTGSVDTA